MNKTSPATQTVLLDEEHAWAAEAKYGIGVSAPSCVVAALD